ncbi:MAG: DMT family transporter [Hyphomicrobiales bacterium]
MTNPPQSNPAQPDQSGDNIKAIILMALSMVLFAFDDAAIKAAGNLGDSSASPGEILIIKGVLGTLVYGALMWREGNRMTPAFVRAMLSDKAIAWRTAGDLLAAGAIVTALTLMPLSNVAAILQVLPLVVTLGAALILRESVGWRRWSAILVGFLGVMIIIRPGTSGYDINTIWALLAVAGLAIRDLAARRMQARFSTFSVVTMVAALLIPTGLGMHWVMESDPLFTQIAPAAWAYILGGGVFGMTAYYAITISTRMGELSVVAPYRYTRLVAALILAYIFFGEVPDIWMILGATLVIGAGLFTLYRERKLRVVNSV